MHLHISYNHKSGITYSLLEKWAKMLYSDQGCSGAESYFRNTPPRFMSVLYDCMKQMLAVFRVSKLLWESKDVQRWSMHMLKSVFWVHHANYSNDLCLVHASKVARIFTKQKHRRNIVEGFFSSVKTSTFKQCASLRYKTKPKKIIIISFIDCKGKILLMN